jgi:uncharacterized protein (TIGR02231 family)
MPELRKKTAGIFIRKKHARRGFKMNGFCERGRNFFAAIAACFALFCLDARGAGAAEGLFIRSADFYPFGAKFTFQVSSGGSFSFTLPGAFAKESVRCLTMEKLTSLKAEAFPVTEAAPPELEPLEKEAEDAQRSANILERRSMALSQTLEMITSPFPQSDDGVKIDEGMLSGYIAYLKDALKLRQELDAELVDTNIALLRAQKAMNDAQGRLVAEISRLEGKKPHNSGNVLAVSGTTSGPAALLFEAFTPAAGWRVVYEMGMDSATGVINAKMNAVAHQRTGMDVSGNLSFHTRQPSFRVPPPEVSPLTVALSLRGNAAESARITASPSAVFQKTEDMVQGSAPAAPEPRAVATLANVTVSGAGKVEGDGSASRVMLGSFSLKSTPVLVSIPEQNREAWIIASMDKVPQAFLPGTAELAVDGASTGIASLPEAAGAIQIPFGMAAKVTSKKTPYVGTQGRSWIVKGIREDGYTLEITSGMEDEIEVEVHDRIPFPTVDKVKVAVKKIDPAPAERDKENRLLWKLRLKPGETKKITVEYSIEYPDGETLVYR